MVQRFVEHVVPGVVRPLRVLWNQMIGFVFLVMGSAAIPSMVRNVRSYSGDAESLFRILLTGVFAALMAYFAVTSFLRARKISRS
jgi:hypothetical protein